MFPFRDHNPSAKTPFVTWTLIALNVGIFLYMLPVRNDYAQLNQIYFDFALIPVLVSNGEGYTGLFTHMFLHGGWMHLLGNMMFLYVFGDNMEDEMGHGGFLIFYLLSGFAAAFAQFAFEPNSQIPMVGASGAIAGVMGGYLLLFPKAQVDILIIIIIIFKVIPIPAWIVLAVWFALQMFGGFSTPADAGGVAYWAHAGGFIAGLLLTVPLWLRRGGPAFWEQTDGHPPHPEAPPLGRTSIPKVTRR